jgi:hypothetical protein
LVTPGPLSHMRHAALFVAAGATVLAAVTACDPSFGLGQPTTRALESEAADTLTAANSFEITGFYSDAGNSSSMPPASNARTNAPLPATVWTVDLQLARPDRQHVIVSTTGVKLEAIIVGPDAYFRGNQYLSQHMGTDPLSRALVTAAGNAWWKGAAGHVPRLPDFTDGSSFTATFLGTAVTQRTDHVSVDGLEATELSGPRAAVFIDASAPHHLLRIQLKKGVVIDGLSDADLRFTNFDRSFQIAAPSDVINFSNLSTLPPLYTVVSVDASGCASPCVVSALVKNLGGMNGARAPSTITFTMTDSASGTAIGGCQAQVAPDVGYNATATVSCTIGNLSAEQQNAAIVTAAADNPGHA